MLYGIALFLAASGIPSCCRVTAYAYFALRIFCPVAQGDRKFLATFQYDFSYFVIQRKISSAHPATEPVPNKPLSDENGISASPTPVF